MISTDPINAHVESTYCFQYLLSLLRPLIPCEQGLNARLGQEASPSLGAQFGAITCSRGIYLVNSLGTNEELQAQRDQGFAWGCHTMSIVGSGLGPRSKPLFYATQPLAFLFLAIHSLPWDHLCLIFIPSVASFAWLAGPVVWVSPGLWLCAFLQLLFTQQRGLGGLRQGLNHVG